MDELGYQSANAIVSHIVNQLRSVEDNNPPETPAVTLAMAPNEKLVPLQANAIQEMDTLMSKIM